MTDKLNFLHENIAETLKRGAQYADIFIQSGEKVMSTCVFPKKPGREIVLSTSGEGCDAEAILYELNGERKSK